MPLYTFEIEITGDAVIEADTLEKAKEIVAKALKDHTHAFDLTPDIGVGGASFTRESPVTEE